VRVTHFDIPSPKYFAPLSPILFYFAPSSIQFLHRFKYKEVRVTHFEIPSAKYFAPFSSILFSKRFRFKEVRVTHFEIPSPKYFAPLSPIWLPQRSRSKELRVTHFEISFAKDFASFSPLFFQVLEKVIESINSWGAYRSLSISFDSFCVFIEILSVDPSNFWVTISVLWNICS